MLEIKDLERVHTAGFNLEDVKVTFNHDIKINVAGMDVEAKQGEMLNVPRWVAELLEQEKHVEIQDTDMVVELKQALVKENVQGEFELATLEQHFYVKLKKSYNPNPDVVAQYEAWGKTRQANLNYLKGELKLKEKARLNIQDAHFAYGIAKTRFSADGAENPNAGDPILDDEGNEVKDEVSGETLVQPDSLPTNKKYVVSRVHPDNFIWDEDAEELEETWSWVAEKIKVTREEAEKDKRFNQKVIKNLKGQKPDDKKTGIVKAATKLFSGEPAKDKVQDIIVYHEVYDIKKRQWFMVAEGGDDFLKDPEGLPPGIEDHPYSILRFTLADKSPYPIPPISQGLGPQNEYNLSRSRLLRHRKRFNRKYEVLMQALTDPDVGLSQLESGEDGTYIGVQQHGAVNPIKDAPLDQQGYIHAVLGVKL